MNHDTILIFFLLALIVFMEIRAYYERKNLLDRIMSRDITELVAAEKDRVVVPQRIKYEEGIPL